ncbi:MAG TPA: MFS transporter [Polyangiaceae bacterium]|nr:MFS transporter [Polyangiaceae bacterium]
MAGRADYGLLFRLRWRGTQDDVFVRWDISPRARARAARLGLPGHAKTAPSSPPWPDGASDGASIDQAIANVAELASRPRWRAECAVVAVDAGPPSSSHLLIASIPSDEVPSRRFPGHGRLSPPGGALAMRRWGNEGAAAGGAGDSERLSLGRMRAQARRKGGGKRRSRREPARKGGVRAAVAAQQAARGAEAKAPPAPAKAPPAGDAEGQRFARGVLAVSCLSVFMSSLNITALYVAFADIGRSFEGASVADLSWVLNAYTIVYAALLVPAGRVADRLGHKRAFFSGLGAFCAASALCGAAPSVATLVGARVLQAFGAALLMPASLALVLGAHAPGRRASALGVWSAVSALAAAFGPALGSVVVQNLGWRWAFFMNVPLALYAMLRGRRAIVEVARDGESRLPDLVGAALLVTALSALALGSVKGPEWGWTSGRVLGALLFGGAASAAFVARSRRAAVPALDLALFSDRSFSLANFATFVFNAGFTAAFFGNVLFLTKAWGYSLQQAGLAVTPGPLTVVPVAIVGGRLADRYGCRPVLFAGGLVSAAGSAWLMRATGLEPNFFATWLPGIVLTGAGVGLVLPVMSGAATSTLPADKLAVGGAVNQAVRQFGAVLGIALVATLLAAAGESGMTTAFAKAYACLIGAGLIASLCGAALPASARARKRAPEPIEGAAT